jgi:hypothetical protein
MKMHSLPSLISSLTVAFLGFTNTASFAQGVPVPITPPKVVDLFEAHARLTPPAPPVATAAVATDPATAPVVIPAGPTGNAEVEARNVDGVTNAEVEISTRGLPDGTYNVVVTKKSDGSSVKVGTFTVATVVPVVTARGVRGDRGEGCNRGGNRKVEFSTRAGTLDPKFDGFDVASILISDSNDNVVLSGDLTQNSELVKRVRMEPDATVPMASGVVTLSKVTRFGVTTPRFQLSARGLAPGALLQIALDGVDTYPGTPDALGRVFVSATGVMVKSMVTIHDATPVDLLKASF